MTAPRARGRRPEREERPDDAAAPPAPESTTARPERHGEGRCNLPGCDETPEWRGLCSAHRQTHRGLADPKESSGD